MRKHSVKSNVNRFSAKHDGDNLETIPDGILLTPDGDPLLDPDGNYIYAGE